MKFAQLNLCTTLQLQRCARARKTRSEALAKEVLRVEVEMATRDVAAPAKMVREASPSGTDDTPDRK